VRVIVGDDSAVIRAGVARILGDGGMHVVAEAADANEAMVCVEEHRPDLAVLDIRMPPAGNSGLVAAEQIRDRYAGSTAVLVLSQYLEPEYALRLLGPGAGGVGYLLKESVVVADELLDAARRVASGGSAIDPAVVDELVRAQRRENSLSALGSRERSVLALLAQGRSNRSIADRLAVSIKTVEGAIATSFMKLGLEPDPGDNRRVLAVLAYLDQPH
jgi:DNA-binding NarL/FixJ family response regulator